MVLEKLRKKNEYVDKLAGIFRTIETDGMITEEKFTEILQNPKVKAYFQTLEIDVQEGAALFHLLDNGEGAVTFEEFIDGIMRCKGPARHRGVARGSEVARGEALCDGKDAWPETWGRGDDGFRHGAPIQSIKDTGTVEDRKLRRPSSHNHAEQMLAFRNERFDAPILGMTRQVSPAGVSWRTMLPYGQMEDEGNGKPTRRYLELRVGGSTRCCEELLNATQAELQRLLHVAEEQRLLWNAEVLATSQRLQSIKPMEVVSECTEERWDESKSSGANRSKSEISDWSDEGTGAAVMPASDVRRYQSTASGPQSEPSQRPLAAAEELVDCVPSIEAETSPKRRSTRSNRSDASGRARGAKSSSRRSSEGAGASSSQQVRKSPSHGSEASHVSDGSEASNVSDGSVASDASDVSYVEDSTETKSKRRSTDRPEEAPSCASIPPIRSFARKRGRRSCDKKKAKDNTLGLLMNENQPKKQPTSQWHKIGIKVPHRVRVACARVRGSRGGGVLTRGEQRWAKSWKAFRAIRMVRSFRFSPGLRMLVKAFRLGTWRDA
eukprot:g24826.t1